MDELRSPKCFRSVTQKIPWCKKWDLHRVNKSTKEFLRTISNMDHFKIFKCELPRPREHIRAMMAMVMTKMLSNVPSAQAMRQMPPSKKLPNWARFRPGIFQVSTSKNLLLWTNGWLRAKAIFNWFTSFPLRKVGVLGFSVFIFKVQISSRFFIPAPIWLARLAKRHARTSDPLISMELRYALEHKESAE